MRVMNEGWHGDEYLILFDKEEIRSASDRYGMSGLLPGFRVVGLRSWDDFIVLDPDGNAFTVPTVPCVAEYLTPLRHPTATSDLAEDQRLGGKIKWYIKPILFGGDPEAHDNLSWVTHDQHAELVRWWNDLYRSLKSKNGRG